MCQSSMRDHCSSQLQHRVTRSRSKPYNVLTCWANAFLWATNQECGCFQQPSGISTSLPSCWDSKGTEEARLQIRRGKPAPGSIEGTPELGGTGQGAGGMPAGLGVQISQGRRRNSEVQCEQLFFIVHLLKQRTATCRVSRTHKPSSFYILIYFFFVPVSMFLKSF